MLASKNFCSFDIYSNSLKMNLLPMDTTRMTNLLAGSQLFSAFPAEALGELAMQAVIKNVPEKGVIFEKGDPGSEMFAILQGRVKISSFSADGKEVIFTILESGDFFGETSLLDDLPRSATCTAVSASISTPVGPTVSTVAVQYMLLALEAVA